MAAPPHRSSPPAPGRPRSAAGKPGAACYHRQYPGELNMIRVAPAIVAAAFAAAPPAAAQGQTPPPTVEQVQRALDEFLAEPHDRITVTHSRDDMKKTSLLVREVATSRTPRRCETEFATPTEILRANTASARSWRLA